MSAQLGDILRYFGDNVAEALAHNTFGQLTDLLPRQHVPISSILVGTGEMNFALKKIISRLSIGYGFAEHFVLSSDAFLAIDPESFRLCCDGTREFCDQWTSFRCRREDAVVFAFRNPHDAILVRMHT